MQWQDSIYLVAKVNHHQALLFFPNTHSVEAGPIITAVWSIIGILLPDLRDFNSWIIPQRGLMTLVGRWLSAGGDMPATS